MSVSATSSAAGAGDLGSVSPQAPSGPRPAALSGTSLGAAGALPEAAPGGKDDSLAELRARAARARDELTQATRKWEQGKARVQDARQRLARNRSELDDIDARLEELREPIAQLVNAAYQEPGVSRVTDLLTASEPSEAIRAIADLHQINREQRATLLEASRLRARQKQLVRASQQLIEARAADARRLEEMRAKLRKKSAQATQDLAEGFRALGLPVSSGGQLPAGCVAERVPAGGYPNGLIPDEALCPLPQGGEMLRADAAIPFLKLNQSYKETFGRNFCVTDSYRSLYEQQVLFAEKPSLAAVPGTSNHGYGLAVDFCGGIESYGSEQYNWMVDNAGRFGWFHPEWAEPWGSRPEPWHWEYNPD